MNEVKDLYQQGMIDKVCYRNYAVKATLHILDSGQCSVVGVLGSGTFGSVVEIQNKQTKVSLAAKIVVQHSVSESELVIWPKLSHPNILPLFAHKLYVDVHTYIFVMPKCPTSLSKMVHQLHFLLDPKALNRAVLWLEGILQGLSYLHGKRLCHLDIKPDNILIAGNDVAVLTDFGFTSSAEKFTTGLVIFTYYKYFKVFCFDIFSCSKSSCPKGVTQLYKHNVTHFFSLALFSIVSSDVSTKTDE